MCDPQAPDLRKFKLDIPDRSNDMDQMSILPTQKEWAAMMREQASEEGQRLQRESVATAERARAAGRSISEQRAIEARGH